MKSEKLIGELQQAGCRILRHGGKHDVYINPISGRKAPVPRHREISNSLCRLIKRQLGVA